MLKTLMVEVTGTDDKITGLVDVLRPYGIEEMVRTGRVAMARGGVGPGSDRPDREPTAQPVP